MAFSVENIRRRFPALAVTDNGQARIYADNPAGTQIPAQVADAVRGLMLENNANMGGHFVTSRYSDELYQRAHEEAAVFLGARSWREVIIGQSMTSLTFHLSRSICRDFKPGDEIVITRMEHEGNVGPWLEMAADKGLVVRWVPFDEETWKVEPDALSAELSPRTRLVCLSGASNMTGSVNDIAKLTALAKQAGAWVFVDAVQLAPHHLIDVEALGCDFLACSAYKFFGPHLGLLWGREEILAKLHPYKGRCVSDELPGCFETGTSQLELFAGLTAVVDYFAELGESAGAQGGRREKIAAAYAATRAHEEPMTRNLIDGLLKIDGVTVYGITNPNRMHERAPTVSIRLQGRTPSDTARHFAERGIFVWHGHNYAYEPALQLGLPLDEGVVRIGLAHYNTEAEVEQIVSTLAAFQSGS